MADSCQCMTKTTTLKKILKMLTYNVSFSSKHKTIFLAIMKNTCTYYKTSTFLNVQTFYGKKLVLFQALVLCRRSERNKK